MREESRRAGQPGAWPGYAQARSVATALDYVLALSRDVRANAGNSRRRPVMRPVPDAGAARPV